MAKKQGSQGQGKKGKRPRRTKRAEPNGLRLTLEHKATRCRAEARRALRKRDKLIARGDIRPDSERASRLEAHAKWLDQHAVNLDRKRALV